MSCENYILSILVIILYLYINNLKNIKNSKLKSISSYILTRNEFNRKDIRNKYIIILNILDYKFLNNKLGIDSGNEDIIKEYAKHLHKNFKQSTIYRLYDDTFAIIISNEYKFSKNMNTYFEYNGNNIKTQKILFYEDKLKDKCSFYEKLNHIKNNTPYNDMKDINAIGIKESLNKEILFHKEIFLAIEHQEFKAHFQPILSNNGKKIIAIEALSRWYKEGGKVITPFFYLDKISNLGLNYEIDIATIKESNKLYNILIRNNDLNLDNFQININISSQTLLKIDSLLNELNNINIPYNNLTFEILEDTVINSEIVNIMNRLSLLGIKISIDDFGSGFMSLQYLKLDIITQVKIDKSLLPLNINNDIKAQQTLKNTVEILNIHDKQIIIEGVENKYHFDYLLKNFNNKTNLQGFYFSKPISNNKLIELIKKNRWLV